MKLCTKCKEVGDFAKNQTWCKVCQKEYREGHKEKHKKYLKKWYKQNPDYDRRRNVENNFNITLEEYDNYFVDASCGICKTKASLVLDHNHSTGKIRGVLCSKCNAGIGLLQDSAYLCAKGTEWLSEGGTNGAE